MKKDPRLISCKTECGNFKCYARRYGLFAEKTCPNWKPFPNFTNGDKVRQMTDEELASIICCQGNLSGVDCSITDCAKCTLDWLKQRAKAWVDNAPTIIPAEEVDNG